MRKADIEIRSPDGLYRAWARYPEMFVDLGSLMVVWEATRELLDVPGRTRELANFPITEAVCSLLYDPDAPACVRSPADVTDAELARAGLSRGDLDFLVACERMNAVENGARFEDVVPAVRFVPAPVGPARRIVRRAPRPRGVRRRVRRAARSPDDRPRLGDSRPRPLAARLGSQVGRLA